MTNKKSNTKGKIDGRDKSRFPVGMTNKKSNSKGKIDGKDKKQIPCGNDKQEKQVQQQKRILRFAQDDSFQMGRLCQLWLA